jgi:hypothetical protein
MQWGSRLPASKPQERFDRHRMTPCSFTSRPASLEQSRDRFECHNRQLRRAGFDPTKAASGLGLISRRVSARIPYMRNQPALRHVVTASPTGNGCGSRNRVGPEFELHGDISTGMICNHLFCRSGEQPLHGGELYAAVGHFLESPLSVPGLQIYRSHGVFQDSNVQTRLTGVKCRRLHAVIGSQAPR